MPDFSKRSFAPEIMDDLNCAGEVVKQTLLEIEYINKKLGGNAITIDGIKQLVSKNGMETCSIADMGCGGGGMLKNIDEWGKRNNIKFELTGIDANPHIVNYAKSFWPNEPYKWKCEDVRVPVEDKYDIIVATLFLHHFNAKEISRMLVNWYDRVSTGIIINDLHRHPLAYYSIKLLTKVFSRSTMVKYDAPLSVLRGLTKSELVALLNKAGIKTYTIKWKWAFRYQVIITKE